MFLPCLRDHSLTTPPNPYYRIAHSYIKHTGFTKDVPVHNYYLESVFPDGLEKTCIMPPTEDEPFSQHITTMKPLKLLSVFRAPGSLRFVA